MYQCYFSAIYAGREDQKIESAMKVTSYCLFINRGFRFVWQRFVELWKYRKY